MRPINNEYHPLNNDFNNNYNTANGVQNDPLINAVPPPVQDVNAVPPPVQTPQPLYQVQQPLYQPQPQVIYQPVVAQPLYSQNVLKPTTTFDTSINILSFSCSYGVSFLQHTNYYKSCY